MFYIVCYDISDDPTRDRMAGALLDFGVRIQESVFECMLEEPDFANMLDRLKRLELKDTDKVRVYRLCQRCTESIVIYGPAPSPALPEYFVV